jgi:hypothetical protein
MKHIKKYILLILNCYKYRDKAIKQKETWLKIFEKNNDIMYFHIIGCEKTCNEKNENYVFDYENNILYTNTKDDYLSLPHKIITAMGAVNDTFDYKYIFKTDDDQKLVNLNFFNILTNCINIKHHYGGFILNVKDHISNYYTIHNELPKKLLLRGTKYCNGRFYLLSKEAVENLLTKKISISKQIIEDHAIGLFLDDKYKENILLINSNKIFIDFV